MKKGNAKATPAGKKILKFLWISFFAIILLLVLLFTLIANGFIGYMPPISELKNPKNKYATEIYSSDMQLLGRYFTRTRNNESGIESVENRVSVNYNDISKNLINALIATEDARFESHSGIDARALGRAVILRGLLHKKSACISRHFWYNL